MTHGVDTDFLVAVEVTDHPFHQQADALDRAEHWWQAKEVVRVFPDGTTVTDFFSWLRKHQLGRKRLLDSLLAATFQKAGVQRIITNNAKDSQLFGVFTIVDFC